ncbi:MAG: hypothetical protein R2932_10380 [Caldilineaceae bacterium]
MCGDNAPWLAILLNVASYLTFIGVCSSAIPMRLGLVATDAYHVFRLLRGGPAVVRQLQIQRLTAQVFTGTPYAALDAQALTAAQSPHDTSRNSYAAHLLVAAQALDRDNACQAGAALNHVLRFARSNPAVYQAGWPFLYAARYELAGGQGPQAAIRWLSLLDRSARHSYSLDLTQARLQVEATIAHARGEFAMAYQCAQQSLALVERRLDRGGAHGERKRLAALLDQLPVKTTTPIAIFPQPAWPTPWFLFQSAGTLIALSLLCTIF